MELLVGEPLSQRLARGPMTPPEAASLGAGMLAALSALHAAGHRPPGPQALERLPHRPRRAASRLRPRSSAARRDRARPRRRQQRRPHEPGPPDRLAPLHGPRADPRPRGGRAHRRLRRRSGPLRGPRRPPRLRGHDARRGPDRDAARRPPAARGRRGVVRSGGPAGAGQGPRRSLPVRRGDGGGPARGRVPAGPRRRSSGPGCAPRGPRAGRSSPGGPPSSRGSRGASRPRSRARAAWCS